MFQLNTPL